MLSIYNIKPKFQQLLRPLLVLFHNMGFTANAITWLAVLLSAFAGLAVWMHPYGLGFLVFPVALLVRMALNALDGMMAREYKQQSKSGEILNELGDVISDLFIFFPLLWLFMLNLYVLLTFMFLSLINEYAGILGKTVSGARRYEGPMGKSDRAFLVGLLSLIGFFWKGFMPYLNLIFLFAIALLIISTASRIYKTLKQT